MKEATFPSICITYDEKTGRPVCVIKAIVEVVPLLLECPLMVTLALALDTHNMRKGLKLKFERVVKAIRKKVTGSTYLLTLEASCCGNWQHT